MSYAKEFDFVPAADSTPEFHFGRTGPVNMWIEFQKSDYSIWRGSFECGEFGAREIIEQRNGEFIVIATGIGYRIDIESNSLKSKIDLNHIRFASKVNDIECLIANYDGFFILDSRDNLRKIVDLNFLDLVEIQGENKEKIIGKFDSSIYEWKTKYFEFDKLTKEVEIKNTPYRFGNDPIWERIKSKFKF